MIKLQVDSSADSVARNKTKDFLASMRFKSVMFFLHFLLDVLTELTYLFTALQRRDCAIGEVFNIVEHTLVARWDHEVGVIQIGYHSDFLYQLGNRAPLDNPSWPTLCMVLNFSGWQFKHQ